MRTIIVILGIIVFCMWFFQNQIVGHIGEKHSTKRIQAITKGIVFRDVYVEGSYGVQQIDIIAVTEKGVLVIEKKTRIGLIVGSAYDKQWPFSTLTAASNCLRRELRSVSIPSICFAQQRIGFERPSLVRSVTDPRIVMPSAAGCCVPSNLALPLNSDTMTALKGSQEAMTSPLSTTSPSPKKRLAP